MRRKQLTVDDLGKLELHDQDLVRLAINFRASIVEICVDCYDDSIDDYETRVFLFEEVTNLAMESCKFQTASPLNIYSCKFEPVNEGLQITLILLMGFGFPSVTCQFVFKHCFEHVP